MSSKKGKGSDHQSMEEISTKNIKKILFDEDTKEPTKKESKDEKKKSKSTRLTTSPTTGSGSPSKARKKILAPPKDKPKMIQKMLAPLDAKGERGKIIVKLNKDKKGILDIDTKAIAEEK